MKLSIVIPAHNEEQNIGKCIAELQRVVRDENHVPYEIIVVNDNSNDGTAGVIAELMAADANVRTVDRTPPGGFGRAVRAGLELVDGDVVVIYMADLSDDPQDVMVYYRKIMEGYELRRRLAIHQGIEGRALSLREAVFQPHCQQMRAIHVLDPIQRPDQRLQGLPHGRGPRLRSLSGQPLQHHAGDVAHASIRRYEIAQVPIRWYGRTWGDSKLKLREMGRKYLCTVLMFYFQRQLISDDLLAERLAADIARKKHVSDLEGRIKELENDIAGRRTEEKGVAGS